MKNKVLLCLIGLLLNSSGAFAQDNAQQVLSTTLPQMLEISKVIVETTEHERDAPLPDVRIKTNSNVNSSLNIVGLSPLRVKIHTNMYTPITVSAEFQELKHTQGLYDFAQSDLSFAPNSYTINNPYDNVITDEFTPTLNVKNDVKRGIYTGKVMFTLGAV